MVETYSHMVCNSLENSGPLFLKNSILVQFGGVKIHSFVPISANSDIPVVTMLLVLPAIMVSYNKDEDEIKILLKEEKRIIKNSFRT